ncbi:hypothetical protein L5515_019418 [Caenorhabditis briggsae]|uniref:Uncharacterized protein n=1 Tax=Caenorhabditis briggsae TaxID=6238 RepID=A0AAE9FJT8_CAEBR|nr:hypothetical protein L5515_019418 [Caenorhabditis briggsae]
MQFVGDGASWATLDMYYVSASNPSDYKGWSEDRHSHFKGPEYQVLTNETSSESSNYTESMTDESNKSSPSGSEKKKNKFFQSIAKVFKKKNKPPVKPEIEANVKLNQSSEDKSISVKEKASGELKMMDDFENAALINQPFQLIDANCSHSGIFSDPFNNDHQIGQSSVSSTNIRFQDQWEQIVNSNSTR